MESKINQRLLNELFLNPTPYDRKQKIYESLKHKFFPCEDVFIDFLSTADVSEQRARAKYIVQRLCFEANFPPPFTLLENLADFETDTLNRSQSESYVPQDHFTHIVYMYLLGIYGFFYQRPMNIALTNEFKRKREKNNFHLAKDATEDFIDYWKYFCLFHDLAYPIEQLCKPGSTLGSGTRYLECFNSLFNCLSREILAECAARFLVLWQMINDDENNGPFSEVSNSLKSMTWSKVERPLESPVIVDGNAIGTQFGEYKAVAKIHCYDHLKMLTGFASAEDYIVVLFDATTEQPVAFKSVTSSKTYYYFLNGNYTELKQSAARDYLDSEDTLPVSDYYIRYYFNFKEDTTQLFYLPTGSGNVFSVEKYRKIVDMLSSPSQSKEQPEKRSLFSGITTSSQLNTYIFQTYQNILSYINSLPLGDSFLDPTIAFPKKTTGLKILNNSKKIDSFIKDKFLAFFKTAVFSQLPFSDFDAAKESLKKLNPGLETNQIKDVIGQAVDDMFKEEAINDYKKQIKEDFSSTLINAIENEKESHGAFVEFISQCNKILFSELSVDNPAVFTPSQVDIQKLFDMINSSATGKPWLDKLEIYIKEKMKIFCPGKDVTLFDFVNSYKTKYISFDHGIYGALIFLLSVQYYFMLIDKLFDSKEPIVDIISTLCWNVERKHFDSRLKKDNSYIVQAVLRSIFCHNLYPEDLRRVFDSSQEWRYEFAKEPSNYFAMMIDSLQVWNRSKYYGLSDVHWWPSFSSDNYDIVIQNDSIILRVMDYGTSLSLIENKFIQKQEEYLKDFSSHVTVDVEHGKK